MLQLAQMQMLLVYSINANTYALATKFVMQYCRKAITWAQNMILQNSDYASSYLLVEQLKSWINK